MSKIISKGSKLIVTKIETEHPFSVGQEVTAVRPGWEGEVFVVGDDGELWGLGPNEFEILDSNN